MPRLFVVASAVVSLGIFATAFTWSVPQGVTVLDRVVPPALADRRSFVVRGITASDDGRIAVQGRVPDTRAISRMRWYVDGWTVAPIHATYGGDRFDVLLQASAHRDRYTVFAYAFTGEHVIAMRDALLVSSDHAVSLVEPRVLAAERVNPSISARAVIDQVIDGAVVMTPKDGTVQLHEAPRLSLVGWALDERRPLAVPRVEVVVDGRIAVVGATGRARPDVARAFHDAHYARSGFSIELPSIPWTTGTHQVEVRVLEGVSYAVGTRLTVRISAM